MGISEPAGTVQRLNILFWEVPERILIQFNRNLQPDVLFLPSELTAASRWAVAAAIQLANPNPIEKMTRICLWISKPRLSADPVTAQHPPTPFAGSPAPANRRAINESPKLQIRKTCEFANGLNLFLLMSVNGNGRAL